MKGVIEVIVKILLFVLFWLVLGLCAVFGAIEYRKEFKNERREFFNKRNLMVLLSGPIPLCLWLCRNFREIWGEVREEMRRDTKN